MSRKRVAEPLGERVSIRMTSEERLALDNLAIQAGQSSTALIREALEYAMPEVFQRRGTTDAPGSNMRDDPKTNAPMV